MEKSGVDLRYQDPYDNKRKFIPHVVEPTFGISRIFLAVLSESFKKDGDRVYLDLPHFLAPFKVAIFPLLANKKENHRHLEVTDVGSPVTLVIGDTSEEKLIKAGMITARYTKARDRKEVEVAVMDIETQPTYKVTPAKDEDLEYIIIK